MEIVTQEVKTLYSIQFTLSEFTEILSKCYKEIEDERCAYPNAFDWLNFEDESADPEGWYESRVRDVLEREMFLKAKGDTYSYIAKHFGFDGWSNGGLWNKNKQVWEMEVFNRGRFLK